MKRLLLAFALLYSSATYAGVGDVYNCMANNVTTVSEIGNDRYENEAFRFQWKEGEIIFSGSVMGNTQHKLLQSVPSAEAWDGVSSSGRSFYIQGKLALTAYTPKGHKWVVIVATCEKF